MIFLLIGGKAIIIPIPKPGKDPTNPINCRPIAYWVLMLGYSGFKEGRKEIRYLTTHTTHFIYGYMASDIW